MDIGFNRWHTNSMKLSDPTTGTEVNIIYKLVDGHETTSLSQVIESFDFGLLAMGFNLKTGNYHDMRSYLFPGFAVEQAQGWGFRCRCSSTGMTSWRRG